MVFSGMSEGILVILLFQRPSDHVKSIIDLWQVKGITENFYKLPIYLRKYPS